MSLLEEYRRYASDHGKHTSKGNAEQTNLAHDNAHRAFLAIMKAGCGNELFSLYSDPDPSVQLWAAGHTLEVDEPRALEKLAQLEEAGIPLISLSAEYTLKEWKSGNLRFIQENPENWTA